jgi:transcriptional regulator with XRE-family HTH domain
MMDAMSIEINRKFGDRLRRLRKKQNWTQVYMAEHSGIDRSYISDMENGKKAVCLPTLQVIAKSFDISISQLLKGL